MCNYCMQLSGARRPSGAKIIAFAAERSACHLCADDIRSYTLPCRLSNVPSQNPPVPTLLAGATSAFVSSKDVMALYKRCIIIVIGPILWGHSGPLYHALSLLPLWTSILHCHSPGVATVAHRLCYSYSWLRLILVMVSTVATPVSYTHLRAHRPY